MQKKKIYIAYTGGTIGMKKSPQGYIPVEGYITDVVNSLPELFRDEMPEFVINEYSPVIDSSNMSPNDWQVIANDIAKNYDEFDGFVVLHGTDTMAYTASALSFMLENLSKPVIVTGSQIPLSEIRSDGQTNLLNALYLAANYPIPEVSLFFNNKLLRGNRSTKADSTGFNAFDSPNFEPLATAGIQIKIEAGEVVSPSSTEPLKVVTISGQPIGVVTLYPGISHTVIANVLAQPVNALIVQSYGVGNAPQDSALIAELRNAHEREILIVNRTQCFRGQVNMDGYATGHVLKDAGALSAADMTLEACLTKLHYLLSQDLSYEQRRSLFIDNLKGERS
ncbi:asparaginase [Psychrosphaera haliotis]|uniref:L-asparaginase 1 n=1 Tax=Psychrosphaera haliotis TaxID=555083 RepID=A0A6N8F484_9GAMM|nr:asparaginase [Psychrosphaera haliotis]MUH71073.1 asparaginase [Psychrosphaera haliotis]